MKWYINIIYYYFLSSTPLLSYTLSKIDILMEIWKPQMLRYSLIHDPSHSRTLRYADVAQLQY